MVGSGGPPALAAVPSAITQAMKPAKIRWPIVLIDRTFLDISGPPSTTRRPYLGKRRNARGLGRTISRATMPLAGRFTRWVHSPSLIIQVNLWC